MRRHAAAADELARAYRAGFAAGLREAERIALQHLDTDNYHGQTCAAVIAEEIRAQQTAPLTRP